MRTRAFTYLGNVFVSSQTKHYGIIKKCANFFGMIVSEGISTSY